MTALPPLSLEVRIEDWPLARPFSIARGSKSAARVLFAQLSGAGARGRGEAVAYPRYGESAQAAAAALESLAPRLAKGLAAPDLSGLLPGGAARNALDCALWDWRAKLTGRPAWQLAGLKVPPTAVPTAYTISLDTVAAMGVQAAQAASMPLLKIKLGDARHDAERIAAVRAAAPKARLVVDANEGWSASELDRLEPVAAAAGVELIEQPLPAGADASLDGYDGAVPLCADESYHGDVKLAMLAQRYRAVNIKLDKAGGLTAALAQAEAARKAGLDIFLGSMVGTSLAVAPALLLAPLARWVDLDGPLLVARDRDPGIRVEAGWLQPPPPALWG